MSTASDKTRADIIHSYSALKLASVNEAETRLKVIDRVLRDVLGWHLDDIAVEERVSEDGRTEYADYIVRTANTAFVIEAKRVGRTFSSVPSRTRTALKGAIMEGETGDAIRQARDYCRKKSIPFAVVSNGAQWIIFPAVRTDGVEFHDSPAAIFDGLESCLGEEYPRFVSLLSRESVIAGELEIALTGRSEDQTETRRLGAFFKTTYNPVVNPIFPLIEQEINIAFTDSVFSSNRNLIEKCYVRNSDRTKFDNRIKMHLAKREPLFHEQPRRPMRKRDANALAEALESAVQGAKPLALLILGSVGSGKTTFLRYTRRVTAAQFFQERADTEYPHWIEIDFLNFAPDGNALDYLIEQIFEYMQCDSFFSTYNRAIRSAYKEQIDALKRGTLFLLGKNEEKFNEKITEVITADYEKKRPFVEKLLKYACSKVPVFLVIDNVDQLEREEIQSKIFANAVAFAGSVHMNLALSMRESTFVVHRHSPTFDAYDFDPIQLEPPELKQVLARRFFVAEHLLQGKGGSFTAANGFKFDVENLAVFVSLVRDSVLGTEVGQRIEVLAQNDIRLGLRMTRGFLERGYTDPAKAIQIYKKSRQYTLPKHEAFRAILLGNHPVYAEEYSVIGNPFDSRLGRTSAQALRMFILGAVVKVASDKTSEYVDGPSIRAALNELGFSDETILFVLRDLCKYRFLFTASHGRPDFESNFAASRLGGYVLKDLIGNFVFVENMFMDTFIADGSVWKELHRLSVNIRDERDIKKKLRLRTQRVRLAFSYFGELFQQTLSEARRRGLPAEWCSDPLEMAEQLLRKDCARALTSARRNYPGKAVKSVH
jgi:hypothetical protein